MGKNQFNQPTTWLIAIASPSPVPSSRVDRVVECVCDDIQHKASPSLIELHEVLQLANRVFLFLEATGSDAIEIAQMLEDNFPNSNVTCVPHGN